MPAPPPEPAKSLITLRIGGSGSSDEKPPESDKRGGKSEEKGGKSGKTDKGSPPPPPPPPMSEAEAQSFRARLVDALMGVWPQVDNTLTASCADHEAAIIWSTIDERDTGFIVDYLLERARRSGIVAQQLRVVERNWNSLRLATIIGPRLGETVAWYPQHGLDLRIMGLPFVVQPRGSRRRG